MIGTTVGSYSIVAKIGEGGMGEVYRARDIVLNRDVALKIIPELFARDPERVERFKREAQALAALNHPHIAHIYGLERSGETSALVMELVEGENLAEQLPAPTPPHVVRVIRRCLRKDHTQRLQHIADARVELLENEASSASGAWSAWTPRGDRLIYRTLTGMWSVDIGGAGEPRRVEGSTEVDFPNAIAPDGDTLAYTHNQAGTSGDIYVLSLTGKFPPKPFVATRAVESNAHFSADGRYLAYASNEPGRSEVYLREYPSGTRRWPVSVDGGSHLLWARNGKTLFFRDRARHVVAVDVTLSPDVKLSTPRVLFDDRYTMSGYTSVANYDVSSDGRRFAMVRDDGAVRLAVLVNYFQRQTGQAR